MALLEQKLSKEEEERCLTAVWQQTAMCIRSWLHALSDTEEVLIWTVVNCWKMKFRSAKFKWQRRRYARHFHTPIRIFPCTHVSAITTKLGQAPWVLPSPWEQLHVRTSSNVGAHDSNMGTGRQMQSCAKPTVLLPCTQHHPQVLHPRGAQHLLHSAHGLLVCRRAKETPGAQQDAPSQPNYTHCSTANQNVSVHHFNLTPRWLICAKELGVVSMDSAQHGKKLGW